MTTDTPTVNGIGFRHSSSFVKLAEALVAAQAEFAPVKKGTTNPFYGSKYAPLDSIIEATRPALTKHGIAVMQSPRCDGKEVVITTLLVHVSGEWIADDLRLPAEQVGKDGKQRFDPQTVGSAITYGRRYAYQSFLGIAAEDDDDANATVRPSSGRGQLATALCYDCGEDMSDPEEVKKMRLEYGKALCRVCRKHNQTILEKQLEASCPNKCDKPEDVPRAVEHLQRKSAESVKAEKAARKPNPQPAAD